MRGTGKGFSATGTTDEGSALSHRLLCLNQRIGFCFRLHQRHHGYTLTGALRRSQAAHGRPRSSLVGPSPYADEEEVWLQASTILKANVASGKIRVIP